VGGGSSEGATYGRRTTVAEAAEVLGISAEAVCIRIRRGTIPVEWGGGTVYVLLDAPAEERTTGDQTDDPIELISELRDRISSLERQMDEERESRRRTDTIIVQLTQANTALTDRLRELEAPSQTIEGRLYEPAEAAVEPAPGANEEPSERPTEPQALRSRWATWRAPSRLVAVIAWVLPLVVTAIGVFYVTLTTLNNQTISAVVGTISWALALAVSLYLNAALRRWQGREDELERALEEFGERMSAVGYNMGALSDELERWVAWRRERLKDDPELEQREKALWEEYQREHSPPPQG
jgi:hypothetical protein